MRLHQRQENVFLSIANKKQVNVVVSGLGVQGNKVETLN